MRGIILAMAVGLALGLLGHAMAAEEGAKAPCHLDMSEDAKAQGLRVIEAELTALSAVPDRQVLTLMHNVNNALLPPGCSIEDLKKAQREGKDE